MGTLAAVLTELLREAAVGGQVPVQATEAVEVVADMTELVARLRYQTADLPGETTVTIPVAMILCDLRNEGAALAERIDALARAVERT